jgi:cobalt-zinc-cadmium resistance protein CzcA
MFKIQSCATEIGWNNKKNEKSKREQFVNQKKKLAKYQEAINYYNQYGKKLSDEIIKGGEH